MTAVPRTVGAVILDWAGTMIDHGSRAPMGAFVRAFAAFGVAITEADARGPMGRAKREHIRAVAALPVIDNVAALPAAVAEIDRRVAAGARPRGAGG